MWTLWVAAAAAEPRNADALVALGLHRYDVESARVELRLEGAQTGVEFIEWTHWGWWERRATHVSMFGQPVEQEWYADGERVVAIDRKAGTGVTLTNVVPARDELASTAILLAAHATRTRDTDEVAGQPCEVWRIPAPSATVCVWRGFTLRSEASVLGMSLRSEATRVEVGATVGTWTIPTDLPLRELSTPPPGLIR
jgi:hypothetical protein